jgi:hypothetical protein
MLDGYSTIFSVRDSSEENAPRANVWVKYVDPSYLKTFRIRVDAGRGIEPQDDDQHQAIALINEAAVRLLFRDGHALGATLSRLPQNQSGGRPVVVAGIVNDVRQRDLDIPAAPEVWLPIGQQSQFPAAVYLTARIENTKLEQITATARRIESDEAGISLRRVRTMDALVRDSLAPQRFLLTALFALTGTALLLATVGVYAVVAYLAEMRTREIGIRIALGASRSQILSMIAREGAAFLSVSLLAGVPMAYASGRMLAGELYQV